MLKDTLIQAFNEALEEGNTDVALGIKTQVAKIDYKAAQSLMLSGVVQKKDNPFKKSVPQVNIGSFVKKKRVAAVDVAPTKKFPKTDQPTTKESENEPDITDGMTVDQVDAYDTYMEMTKNELIGLANEFQLEFNQRQPKAEIAALLAKHK